MSREPKPDIEWDDLYASVGFKPLWRLTRGLESMNVQVRERPGGMEYWFQQEMPDGKPPLTRKKEFVASGKDGEGFLKKELERLLAEGWKVEPVN